MFDRACYGSGTYHTGVNYVPSLALDERWLRSEICLDKIWAFGAEPETDKIDE